MDQSPGSTEPASPLPRKFGGWTGWFTVVAAMVGMGILTTSGYTIRATENHTVLLLIFAVAGLLALAGALTIAELATALPKVGGDYVFVHTAYGPATAFAYGWATLLLGFAGPTALIAHAAIEYLLIPIHAMTSQRLPAFVTPLLASLVILLFTWSHCRGHRWSAWLQDGTTLFKLATLVLFVIIGLMFGTGDFDHFAQGSPLVSQNWSAVAVALIYATYAYSGWNGAVYLAGEIRNPAKMLPWSLIGGTATVMALYLGLNVLYGYALAPTALADMPEDRVVAIAETAGRQLFGAGVSVPFAAIIGAGILASVSAYILTGPRMVFAMARDGLFPAFAGAIHPIYQTPARATVLQATLSLVVLWAADTFETLLNYTTIGLAALSALSVSSIFVLRRQPWYQPAYRTFLYPLPPLVYCLATLWMIAWAGSTSPVTTTYSLLSILVAYPVYFLVRPWLTASHTQPATADV